LLEPVDDFAFHVNGRVIASSTTGVHGCPPPPNPLLRRGGELF
jgi:hypothetical protein